MKKYILFLIGLLIISLGVNFAVISNMGLAPWDAINFALSAKSGLSTGTCINILSIILLALTAIFTKKRIKLQCFVTAFLLGFAIDFWNIILSEISVTSLFLRAAFFFAGLILISLGIAIYLSTHLPENAIDYVMVEVRDNFKLKTFNAKLIIDLICILTAFLIQGPIGIGTILLTFCSGPLIGFFERILRPILVYNTKMPYSLQVKRQF